MKLVLSALFVAITFGLVAQKKEVSLKEELYSFSVGSKNAITVTLPDSKKDVVNKVLTKEIKSWGGKMKNDKTEITTLQSVDKKIFDGKAFDTYTRIYQDGQDTKISVAVDLGGAFMTSAEHPAVFDQFKEKLYKFALNAGEASIAQEVKAEEKMLKTMNKDLKSLDKTDDKYQKEIDKLNKQIEQARQDKEANKVQIETKKKEIKEQEEKIKGMKKTKVK